MKRLVYVYWWNEQDEYRWHPIGLVNNPDEWQEWWEENSDKVSDELYAEDLYCTDWPIEEGLKDV